VIAGVTLAARANPEVMGYTKIAGAPIVAFAIFGCRSWGDSRTAVGEA